MTEAVIYKNRVRVDQKETQIHATCRLGLSLVTRQLAGPTDESRQFTGLGAGSWELG